jgi:hypothetical protein
MAEWSGYRHRISTQRDKNTNCDEAPNVQERSLYVCQSHGVDINFQTVTPYHSGLQLLCLARAKDIAVSGTVAADTHADFQMQ